MRFAATCVAFAISRRAPGSIVTTHGAQLERIAVSKAGLYFDDLWVALSQRKIVESVRAVLSRLGPGVSRQAIERALIDALEPAIGKELIAVAPRYSTHLIGPTGQGFLEAQNQIQLSITGQDMDLGDEFPRLVIGTGTESDYYAGEFTRPVPEQIIRWAEETLARHVTGVNTTTKDDIARIISGELARGASVDAAAAELRKQYPKLSDWRSRLIANMEINHAMSTGAYARARDLGSREKRAITADDERVRETHQANQGQGWIAIGSYFAGTGHESTPFGFACRCTVTYRGAQYVDPQAPRMHIGMAPQRF